MDQQQNPFSRLLSHIGIILCLFLLIIAAYAPIVQTAFLWTDDYIYFKPGGRTLEFCLDREMKQGRILNGLSVYALSKTYQSIDSTKTIHFIGIVGLTFFAYVLYVIFKRCRFRSDHSFFMSLLICMLPSSQIIVAWMVCTTYTYSAALSSIAAMIMLDYSSGKSDQRKVNKIAKQVSAVILMIIALNLYQSTAMMYWAVGVIYFLTRKNCNYMDKEFRRYTVTFFFIGLFSMAFYYLIFIKIIPTYFYPAIEVTRGAVKTLTFKSTVLWFIARPLKHALNLWYMKPNLIVTLLVSTVIITGIRLNILRERREIENIATSSFVTKYLLITLLIILTYLHLILVISAIGYRNMVAISPALSMLLFFAIFNIVEYFNSIPSFSSRTRNTIITVFFVVLTVVTGISAYNNLNNFAALHAGEFRFVENAIRDYGVNNLLRTGKIHFRRPRALQEFRHEYRFYEFLKDLYSFSETGLAYPYHKIRGIEPGEIEGGAARRIVKLALSELGVDRDIQIIQTGAEEPLPKDTNILIIDMVKFQSLFGIGRPE